MLSTSLFASTWTSIHDPIIGAAIQSFRHNHGGIHYELPELIAEGEQLLVQEAMIRKDVDRYVQETYENWS